jgi:RNA polymerase sigma factor (sigma-70 family)
MDRRTKEPREATEFDSLESQIEDEFERSRAEESWHIMRAIQRGRADDATDQEKREADVAFAQFYDRYHAEVRKVIFYRVGRDPQLADDLTADVFVRAFKAAGNVTWQGKDMGAWLHVIAVNISYDYVKSAYHQRVVNGLDDTAIHYRPDTSRLGDPEKVALARVRREELLRAVGSLTPDQRDAVILRYFEERSVQETAEAMGREQGAVKGLTTRAMRALNRLLSSDESDKPPTARAKRKSRKKQPEGELPPDPGFIISPQAVVGVDMAAVAPNSHAESVNVLTDVKVALNSLAKPVRPGAVPERMPWQEPGYGPREMGHIAVDRLGGSPDPKE